MAPWSGVLGCAAPGDGPRPSTYGTSWGIASRVQHWAGPRHLAIVEDDCISVPGFLVAMWVRSPQAMDRDALSALRVEVAESRGDLKSEMAELRFEGNMSRSRDQGAIHH